jgi:hypothetical protein
MTASVAGLRPTSRLIAGPVSGVWCLVSGVWQLALKASSAWAAAPMMSPVVVAGPLPSWVKRSPHSSVLVVSSYRTLASQPRGTCGVSICRTRCAPTWRTWPSASGTGGRRGDQGRCSQAGERSMPSPHEG